MARPKGLTTLTKVQQLTDLLEKDLKGGKYCPGSRIPSERALGEKYGISHMTANKAVAMLVAKGLLKRVQGDGTYVTRWDPGMAARTIGVVMEMKPKDHIAGMFPNLMTSYSQDKGYFLAHFDSTNYQSLEESLFKFLDEKPYGLFINGDFPRLDALLEHVDPGTVLVFLLEMQCSGKKNASAVLSDFERGGIMAVEHLVKSGRERIAVLSGERKPGIAGDLFCLGCERAMRENGIEDGAYLASAAVSEDDYLELLRSPRRPDGVVAVADWRAAGFLRAARKLGLDAPGDLSVIGYFDTPWAEAYGLTSLL